MYVHTSMNRHADSGLAEVRILSNLAMATLITLTGGETRIASVCSFVIGIYAGASCLILSSIFGIMAPKRFMIRGTNCHAQKLLCSELQEQL